MIDVTQYFGGRRETHGTECSPGIEDNAVRTVGLVNELLEKAEAFGIVLPSSHIPGDYLGTQLTSGWRPPSINACTAGAAPQSLHMTGEACDIFDPDGELDVWLLTPEGQYVLQDFGLWMEDPGHTMGWCHVQIRPPKSGRRVFLP